MRAIDADRLSAVLQKNFGHTGGAAVMQQLIDIAPTIDPVKHGKWIFDLSDVDWTYGPYVCSECHVRNGDFIGGGLNKRTNYCPNCGARMDAEEEKR